MEIIKYHVPNLSRDISNGVGQKIPNPITLILDKESNKKMIRI